MIIEIYIGFSLIVIAFGVFVLPKLIKLYESSKKYWVARYSYYCTKQWIVYDHKPDVYFHDVTGPFSDKKDAEEVCNKLNSEGSDE